MPNYTITRQTEPNDLYGCTNFETSQNENELANLPGGVGQVDGDIIWYIDANAGFTVNVDDFNIPNSVATAVPQIPGSYRTFQGGDIPPPILGIVMEQVTATRIKVTLYLHPIAVPHGIVGPVFVMPGSDVSASVPIIGCAELAGEGVDIAFKNTGDTNVETELLLSNTHAELTQQQVDEVEDKISGVLKNSERNELIATYTISVNDGDRFSSEPTITATTADYNITSTVVNDVNGNMTSKTFNIFKAL